MDKKSPCHDNCEDTEKDDEHTKFLSDAFGSEWNVLISWFSVNIGADFSSSSWCNAIVRYESCWDLYTYI